MTFSMVTFEQTEKVETGLDVAIKAEDGRIIAWAYDIQMASEICHNLNNPATMNNQETNERLATLCGYLGQAESLPNYCNDLNAMSEVETWMVGRGYGGSYQAELQAMAGGYLSYHLASASQRARAAILALENAKGDA